MLYTPIKRISSFYNQFQVAIASNERINEIFAQNADIKEGRDVLQSKIDKISFKNVELRYDDNVALKDIDLTAYKGEKIALCRRQRRRKKLLCKLIVKIL